LLGEEDCIVNSKVRTKCRALFNDALNCWKYRASVVEWYRQKKVKVRGKKSVSVPFCLPKSHVDWPGMKPGSPRETLVAKCLSHGAV